MTQQPSLHHRIADAIQATEQQTQAAIELLDGGATVPFIARYRKEQTGGLTDTQLRQLEERLSYLRELDQRRDSIIETINEQGKLTDSLKQRLLHAETKSQLEDLYLPYRKKRRTKGQIAIEAGLEPLADLLWNDPQQTPDTSAVPYVDQETFTSVKTVLEGARYILMERFAEDADLIARLRQQLTEQGWLCASRTDSANEDDAARFSDYFDHQERYQQIPGHRALAMFRGRSAGVLSLKLLLKEEDAFGDTSLINSIGHYLGFQHKQQPADDWRAQVISWTWKVKLSMHLETELLSELRQRADHEAIDVFARNLKDLLLAPPAGARCTLGLDPGYRSGVKVCVVDATGKLLAHTTIYPHKPQQQWQQSLHTLTGLCCDHNVELIAIGNGTASRETEKLCDELIAHLAQLPAGQRRHPTRVMVSEAGASVYSASQQAEQEFPELDVTIRGAVSIARRLQDPLAELVKIDPKAIGVGQYQHDVSQNALAKSLDATVEDCVNGVGVDLDTASAALLGRVAGLNSTLAENIVRYRDEQGAFETRKALLKVPRLGPRAFEQAAGFLRIRKGKNPLDASGVHPESYPVVERIIEQSKCSLDELIGNREALNRVDPRSLVSEDAGLPTITDILAELEKPGRDPRPEFKTVRFADGIDTIKDLVPDQVLEGQVTNVTAFGAFVDVGVHQDGLVHISALSHTFVKDPHQVVKAGDIVKVKVMSVDIKRQRIALSMRLDDQAESQGKDKEQRPSHSRRNHNTRTSQPQQPRQKKQPAAEPDSALALQLKAALSQKNS